MAFFSIRFFQSCCKDWNTLNWGFLDIAVTLLHSNDLCSHHIPVQLSTFGMHWRGKLALWLHHQQIAMLGHLLYSLCSWAAYSSSWLNINYSTYSPKADNQIYWHKYAIWNGFVFIFILHITFGNHSVLSPTTSFAPKPSVSTLLLWYTKSD